MKSRLLNGLEPDLKTTVEREFNSSSHLRKRIKELMQADIESLQRLMREDTAYDSGSWPYKQAEKLGETKALLKLISLL